MYVTKCLTQILYVPCFLAGGIYALPKTLVHNPVELSEAIRSLTSLEISTLQGEQLRKLNTHICRHKLCKIVNTYTLYMRNDHRGECNGYM